MLPIHPTLRLYFLKPVSFFSSHFFRSLACHPPPDPCSVPFLLYLNGVFGIVNGVILWVPVEDLRRFLRELKDGRQHLKIPFSRVPITAVSMPLRHTACPRGRLCCSFFSDWVTLLPLSDGLSIVTGFYGFASLCGMNQSSLLAIQCAFA